MDTPDIDNLHYGPDEREQEVQSWKRMTSPDHPTILLALRCDEEFAIYKDFKRLWGDNAGIRRHLVVAFTFGDKQDRDLKEELEGVCDELKSVLKDANHRYMLFNKKVSRSVCVHVYAIACMSAISLVRAPLLKRLSH